MLARMIAVLLAFGAHDHALELVEAAQDAGGLEVVMANDLRAAVTGSVISPSTFLLRGGIALLLALAVGAVLLPSGQRGRNVGGAIVASQAAPLFHALYLAAARGGLRRSCIADPV